MGSDDTASNNTSVPTSAPISSKAQKKKYEILEHKMVKDSYCKYVVGKIKNNSGRDIDYLEIDINLYDNNGNQVGSTLDNITNFEKDGIWNFKAAILEDEATEYKIMETDGF